MYPKITVHNQKITGFGIKKYLDYAITRYKNLENLHKLIVAQFSSFQNGLIKPTLQVIVKIKWKKSLKVTFQQCQTHRKCSRNGKCHHRYDYPQYAMLFCASFPLLRLCLFSGMTFSQWIPMYPSDTLQVSSPLSFFFQIPSPPYQFLCSISGRLQRGKKWSQTLSLKSDYVTDLISEGQRKVT